MKIMRNVENIWDYKYGIISMGYIPSHYYHKQ